MGNNTHLKILLFCLVFLSFSGNAQIYLDKGKSRYTFAQTTIGYDFDYTPSYGSSYQLNSNNQLEKFTFRNKITPVITITGLHFWGHAEFFTGFSLFNIDYTDTKNRDIFRRSASTGAKYFPWAIKSGSIRPYLGMAISGFKFKKDEAATYRRVEYPVLAGLTYSFKRGILEIGGSYFYANRYSYYITRSENVPLNTPPFSLNIDFKYYFDFSILSHKKDENGENKKLMEYLTNNKRRSSLFFAAGPAYSFVIGNSSYNKSERPYLDDYKITSMFPDIGVGYYNFPGDLAITISWRKSYGQLSGHNVSQYIRRNSIALEAYKFIGDYHGFVPFIGGMISSEFLKAEERESGNILFDNERHLIGYGIIGGWDIRPTRVDWWGIRTNIRYFPNLQVHALSGKYISFNQIELNFLQLVVYPSRIILKKID